MKVITEAYLRKTFLSSLPERLNVAAGQILTPAAMDLLREKKVEIIRGSKASGCALKSAQGSDRGGQGKPEHLTQLCGPGLVAKDHPRIALRGRLDSLQAETLLLQWQANKGSQTALATYLGELVDRIRQILKAEVSGEAMTETNLLGLSAVELRDCSQRPEKHFGCSHLLPDIRMGEWLLLLNRLRTQVREVELVAVKELLNPGGDGVERPDILEALNRMSSAVYILMLKEQVECGDS